METSISYFQDRESNIRTEAYAYIKSMLPEDGVYKVAGIRELMKQDDWDDFSGNFPDLYYFSRHDDQIHAWIESIHRVDGKYHLLVVDEDGGTDELSLDELRGRICEFADFLTGMAITDQMFVSVDGEPAIKLTTFIQENEEADYWQLTDNDIQAIKQAALHENVQVGMVTVTRM